MTHDGLSPARLDHLVAVMSAHTTRRDGPPGLAWLLARHGVVHAGTAGTMRAGTDDPVARDSIFRIASMTKPVTAVGALVLVEECALGLDDPVDEWLPELADRRVLTDPDGPLDVTVPATRPITVYDLLTFRMGLGYDFTRFGSQPTVAAMGELGIGAGPPRPADAPGPDEWLARLATLPLEYQPGARWMYHVGAQVLGVLVERISGQGLGPFLTERVFEPLGMHDTGFSVPDGARDRFGPCYAGADEHGARDLFDDTDGMWSAPPAFAGGGDGLVSTVDDYFTFAEMLRRGGEIDGTRILSRPTVAAMTRDHLTGAQRAAAGPDPSGRQGWGLGVGVWTEPVGTTWSPGTYGWDGGLGSTWANDPAEGLVGILLTNQAFTSPELPRVCRDFWTCVYGAVVD